MRQKLVSGVAGLALLFSLSVMANVGARGEADPLCVADNNEIEALAEGAACLDNGCEADTGVCGKASSGGSCWCLY
jgi:hypothetical protein